MSDKIKKQVAKNNKDVVLTDVEFTFMNSLDVVERSFAYYLQQLKTEYLQTIAINNGFTVDDKLQLSIDLKDESKTLKIEKVIEQEQ